MFKVLIVEDEDLIRKGLAYIFDWLKYNCVVVGEATNGQEALDIIEKETPDIVITDIKMPIMDGLQLLEKIQDKHIETIIISGYAEFGYAKEAIKYGVSEYILKPINHQSLGQIIEVITQKITKENLSMAIQEKVKSFEEIKILDMEIYYHNNNYLSRYTPKVLEFIKENYKRKISIDYIADNLEVSSTYLSKKFKEDTKHTFNDFLNRFRIQKALDYMLELDCDMKIYEIAEEVGFSEYKYFSQVFKNYMKYSPSDFLQLDLFIKE